MKQILNRVGWGKWTCSEEGQQNIKNTNGGGEKRDASTQVEKGYRPFTRCGRKTKDTAKH